MCTFTLGVNYMALKYNKPLMTKRDLKSGENVSLLMFIHSKMQMQKLFDDEKSEDQDGYDQVLKED